MIFREIRGPSVLSNASETLLRGLYDVFNTDGESFPIFDDRVLLVEEK